jgi:hypothetical protein
MTHEDQVALQTDAVENLDGQGKRLFCLPPRGTIATGNERRRARARITRWKGERPPACTRQPLLSFRELVSSRSRPIPSFSAKAGKRILARVLHSVERAEWNHVSSTTSLSGKWPRCSASRAKW